MELRRTIISISLVLVIVMSWQLVLSYLNKKHPDWGLIPTSQPAATQPLVSSSSSSTTAPATAAAAGGAAAQPSGGLAVTPADNPATVEIGSATVHEDPTYPLGLILNPAGAGLDSATLNDYYDTAEKKSLYSFQQPLTDTAQPTRPLAMRTLTINGRSVDLSGLAWAQSPGATASSVTFVATINNGGKPAVEVDRTFSLQPRNATDGSGGYEVGVVQVFKNLGAHPVQLKAEFNGPTAPPRESDRSEDRQFIAGYDDDRDVTVSGTPLTYFSSSHPSKDLVQADSRPMLWTGASSAYFDAIVRPDYTGQSAAAAIRIAAVNVEGTNLDGAPEDRSAAMTIDTQDFTVAPASASTLNLKVFLGPKKRELLKDAYYAKYPLGYDRTLVTSGGCCGFLTFQPLITALYGILWFFHLIFRDWGIAIICLVLLVRALLHPITRKSQVNMMQMGKMGPELERLKKKYGDNKDELNKAMMQFYKEQGMTPVLGCLPMFLQTPIWIALWSALQSTFELRQAPFLRFGWLHLTWIKDLSRPDALIHFAAPVHLLGWLGYESPTIYGINVLPILMAVVAFVQQRMMPAPATTTPEQDQQRKMMQWMSLLFPIILYSGPSGLNLYILTSTSLGIVESKIIRDHIKQREEAEKAGKIVVPTKATRASKRRDGNDRNADQKPGRIAKIFADLQAKAEQLRREAERRQKERG